MSTCSWAVPPWATIGPVDCFMPDFSFSALVSRVTSCCCVVWLVMMRTMGPAPKPVGDTDTRLVDTLAVTLIGSGGRSVFL